MEATRFLKVQERIFSFTSINIHSVRDSRFSAFFQCFHILSLSFYMVSIFSFIYHNLNNIDIATEALSPWLTGCLCIYKIVIFEIHRSKFTNAIDRFKWSTEKAAVVIGRKNIFEEKYKFSERISRAYFYSCLITGVASLFVPLGLTVYFYNRNNKLQYFLPFKCILPYNYETIPGYTFTLVWTAHSLFVAICFACGLDTSFCALSLNIRGHFDTLREKINDLKENKPLDQLEYIFKEIHVYHKEVRDLINILNTTFKPVIFMQFLISSIQICVIGYQLAKYLNEPKSLFFSFFLIAVIIQVLIYCYGGEIIRLESQEISADIYMKKWQNLPPKIIELLTIEMMNTRKGKKICAIFFSPNMHTFLKIVNTALGYIALLRALDKNIS